jgi:hypothetical protein
MPSTPSDMLHYYHGCLLQYLQKVKDYELQTVSITEKVSSALATLKASTPVVLDAVPSQQSQDSPISESLIDTLHQALVSAQTAWTTQVGEPQMHYGSKNQLQLVYEPAPGEDNKVIYAVTKLIRDCLTYLENIKAVLPKARAEVRVGNPEASMHALLQQLDALK